MPVTRKELAVLIKQSMDKDKENIINLARQAGLEILSLDGEDEVGCGDGYHIQTDLIERFAALVVEHEREACAKVCEGINDGTPYNLAAECAAAIRSRT